MSETVERLKWIFVLLSGVHWWSEIDEISEWHGWQKDGMECFLLTVSLILPNLHAICLSFRSALWLEEVSKLALDKEIEIIMLK